MGSNRGLCPPLTLSDDFIPLQEEVAFKVRDSIVAVHNVSYEARQPNGELYNIYPRLGVRF